MPVKDSQWASIADADRPEAEPSGAGARPAAPAAASDDEIPLVGEIRTRAAAIAREEVARTLRRLTADPDVAERLDAMAGAIVSKLLREPTVRLRRAASEGGSGDAIVAAARAMFLTLPDGPRPRRNVA